MQQENTLTTHTAQIATFLTQPQITEIPQFVSWQAKYTAAFPNTTVDEVTPLDITAAFSTEEITTSKPITFYDTNNTVMTQFLDVPNSRIIFPSGFYTYGTQYAQYMLRCRFNVTTVGSISGNIIIYNFDLLRFTDNSLVTRQTFEINDIGNGEALDVTIFVPYTFTSGINTDPYEVGGIRCVLSKSPLSTDTADITVQNVDLRIVRNVK